MGMNWGHIFSCSGKDRSGKLFFRQHGNLEENRNSNWKSKSKSFLHYMYLLFSHDAVILIPWTRRSLLKRSSKVVILKRAMTTLVIVTGASRGKLISSIKAFVSF